MRKLFVLVVSFALLTLGSNAWCPPNPSQITSGMTHSVFLSSGSQVFPRAGTIWKVMAGTGTSAGWFALVDTGTTSGFNDPGAYTIKDYVIAPTLFPSSNTVTGTTPLGFGILDFEPDGIRVASGCAVVTSASGAGWLGVYWSK